MIQKCKAIALSAAFAMLTAPVGATAGQRAKMPHVEAQVYYPVPSGFYAGYYGVPYNYGYGWRHRSNARGWDNTCLNLPWLPSEFACSSK